MERNSHGSLERFIVMVTDIVLINVGLYVALFVQNGFVFIQLDRSYVLLASLLLVICFYLSNLFTVSGRTNGADIFYKVIIANACIVVLFYLITILFLKPVPLPVVLGAFLLQTIFIFAFHLMMLSLRKHYNGQKRVLVVAENSIKENELTEKMLSHSKGWFVVKRSLSIVDQKQINVCLSDIDVVLLSSSVANDLREEIMQACVIAGIEVLVVPTAANIYMYETAPAQIGDMLVYTMKAPRLTRINQLIKRVFDIFIAGLIVVITSPLLLLLLFIIPKTSRGPAIYKQERLGLHGKPYWMYKFRSMVDQAEKDIGPVLATEQDPRITRIGRLLRATRIDELPQLFNVLKGEMSVVGPRPERAFFINQFTQDIPAYTHRLAVKPGVTGLAQTYANYATTVNDKLAYDLHYIRNYSFILDVKIIIQTIQVVLQRDQAAGVKESVHEESTQRSTVERRRVINQ